MQTTRTSRTHARSGGFTLVELLVVMVIIAILMGLGIGLLGTAGTQARVAQTQTTLKYIDAIMGQRTEAFRAADLTKIVEQFEKAYEAANMGSSFTAQDRKAAEILVRKNLFRQLFPTKIEDLYGMDGVSGTWDDHTQATALSGYTAAELLYWSLTEGTAYGLSPATLDGLPSAAISQSANGRNILVDGWGTPIQLFRWPTGLMTSANRAYAKALIPGLPATINKDPDDPLRVLEKNSKFSNFAMPPVSTFALSLSMSTINANAFSEANYHERQAFHTPLLVSAGPDRGMGITGDHADTVDAATVADNVTNRQGR